MKPILFKSTITCPECGFQKEETMPEDSCQFFYECEKCKTVLKPKEGDCCGEGRRTKKPVTYLAGIPFSRARITRAVA